MREMGKAMMGTGEAQGDKRALTAAEAAISNPLIDDASMKGARGLLISITGGRDLTLYEVDEAATRIREEVDQDANIIVGATFDESLDGMIRVSVVATGIDQALAQHHRPSAHHGAHTAHPPHVTHAAPTASHTTHAAPAPAPAPQPSASDSRLADLAQRIRADNQRIAERIEATTRTPAPVAAPPTAPAAAPAQMAAPVAQPMGAITAPASLNASIESAAKAAIAAAVEDITIRPIAPPKPSLFIDPAAREAEPPQVEEPRTFIPPQAERMPTRAPRMPRIDELPVPAQNEIRARRGEMPEDHHPEKQRMSLLQRLASVGLGRREADEPAPAPRAPAPMPERPAAARPPMPRPEPRHERQDLRQDLRQDPRHEQPVSEYAKQRPAPSGLDQHGRQAPLQAPVHNSGDEDQLDIPAFLRRQAN
jgi:cell division protein FtsZ